MNEFFSGLTERVQSKILPWDFLGGLVVKTVLPIQETWVQVPIRELRTYTPHGPPPPTPDPQKERILAWKEKRRFILKDCTWVGVIVIFSGFRGWECSLQQFQFHHPLKVFSSFFVPQHKCPCILLAHSLFVWLGKVIIWEMGKSRSLNHSNKIGLVLTKNIVHSRQAMNINYPVE